MFKMVKVFKDVSGCLEIATMMKQQMDDFKPHVPLIVALRNKGMRDRHWDKLAEQLGMEIKPDEVVTLEDIIAMELSDNLKAIEEVSDWAAVVWE